MTRKLFATLLKTGSVAFLLFALLFAGGAWQSVPGFIGSFLREITAVLRDSETQWMVFLCLGIYFTAFIFLHARLESGFTQNRESAMATGWLVFLLFISATSYSIYYLPFTPALTLLAGALIGQGGALLKSGKRKAEGRNGFCALVTFYLVVLLVLASVWNGDSSRSYAYHNHTRWIGPWDNPNLFGLLMGTGLALAVGSAVFSFQSSVFSQAHKLKQGWKIFYTSLCLVAVMLMGRGLLHSYSRGAWLATAVGLAYLIANSEFRIKKSEFGMWLKRNWLALAVIMVAVGAICFWHLRQTNWHPARRAISAVNPVDFSWRNRVAAWEGDLQMMAEHPWLGVGWSQAEPMYQHFYLPPKLTESAAIEMNDDLMLGATLGVPALFCFGMYLWLSLIGKVESGTHLIRPAATFSPSNAEKGSLDCLQTTCRAGAIVLLVGFWFDGGLFKLPTAATFWILLELGSVINREQREIHEND